MIPLAGAAPPRRPRIKPTVEVFAASDGHVYLLPGGGRPHQVIRSPGALARDLLAHLDGQQDLAGLVAGLRRRGHVVTTEEVAVAVRGLAALGVLEDAAEAPPPELSKEEILRFDRQLAYFADVAPDGTSRWDLQLRLARARVVVIGTGGLGSWSLSGLASAGIGNLVLVDDDVVELSNLNRQILFRRSDVGRPKVDAARDALEAFNPSVRVEAVRRRVAGAAEVEELAGGADFVVATADRPAHSVARWVNTGCWRAGVPYISAGQDPPLVRIGPTYWPGRSGCLDCSEHGLRASHPLFDELAAFRDARPSVAATLGPASGVIGSLIAMEVVHALTGVGDPATLGVAVVIDLRTLATERSPVRRRRGCAVCDDGVDGGDEQAVDVRGGARAAGEPIEQVAVGG